METDIPPIFIVLLGIAILVAIQFVFACLIFGVLMVWNFIVVDPVNNSSEVKKSDLEKGQESRQTEFELYLWNHGLPYGFQKLIVKCMVENCNNWSKLLSQSDYLGKRLCKRMFIITWVQNWLLTGNHTLLNQVRTIRSHLPSFSVASKAFTDKDPKG